MKTFVFEYIHSATNQVRTCEIDDTDIGDAYDRYLKGGPDDPLLRVGFWRHNPMGSYVQWLEFGKEFRTNYG